MKSKGSQNGFNKKSGSKSIEKKSSEGSRHCKENKKNEKNYLVETPRSRVSEYEKGLSAFNQTAGKLYETNFSHHHSDCLCNECDCGRHLCKFNCIKPDITKKTVYGQSFQKNAGSKYQNKPVRPFSSEKVNPPHLDMNSTYRGSFYRPTGDSLERPKPKDQLSCGGPSLELTSYSNGFPGHKGKNQYVKMTSDLFRGGLPFQGETSYKSQFYNHNGAPEGLAKPPNSSLFGTAWLGKSHYQDSFKNPNPENYPEHVKVVEKREINPDFNHQYETTYKNDFLKTGNAQCPAKVVLQTKRTGVYKDEKGKFLQNSDFRSMNPNFQSYSGAKTKSVFA